MATRKRCLPLHYRRTSSGREQQVQRFTESEIQTLKALASAIQETMDPDRYACAERTPGSFWADVYFRSGTQFREIHNPLPTRILRPKPIREVRVHTQGGRVVTRYRPDKPTRTPTKRGRVSGNARTPKSCVYCGATRISKTHVC